MSVAVDRPTAEEVFAALDRAFNRAVAARERCVEQRAVEADKLARYRMHEAELAGDPELASLGDRLPRKVEQLDDAIAIYDVDVEVLRRLRDEADTPPPVDADLAYAAELEASARDIERQFGPSELCECDGEVGCGARFCEAKS